MNKASNSMLPRRLHAVPLKCSVDDTAGRSPSSRASCLSRDAVGDIDSSQLRKAAIVSKDCAPGYYEVALHGGNQERCIKQRIIKCNASAEAWRHRETIDSWFIVDLLERATGREGYC